MEPDINAVLRAAFDFAHMINQRSSEVIGDRETMAVLDDTQLAVRDFIVDELFESIVTLGKFARIEEKPVVAECFGTVAQPYAVRQRIEDIEDSDDSAQQRPQKTRVRSRSERRASQLSQFGYNPDDDDDTSRMACLRAAIRATNYACVIHSLSASVTRQDITRGRSLFPIASLATNSRRLENMRADAMQLRQLYRPESIARMQKRASQVRTIDE